MLRAKTIKLSEENIRVNLYDLEFDQVFLHMIPKVWAIKEKVDKMDFIKIENFCASKDTIKLKIHPQIGKKYLQIMYLVRDLYY